MNRNRDNGFQRSRRIALAVILGVALVLTIFLWWLAIKLAWMVAETPVLPPADFYVKLYPPNHGPRLYFLPGEDRPGFHFYRNDTLPQNPRKFKFLHDGDSFWVQPQDVDWVHHDIVKEL